MSAAVEFDISMVEQPDGSGAGNRKEPVSEDASG